MVDARDARDARDGMTASQPGFHVIMGTQQAETNMIRWAFCIGKHLQYFVGNRPLYGYKWRYPLVIQSGYPLVK